jgi:uncharacterized protein (DUF1778 family)
MAVSAQPEARRTERLEARVTPEEKQLLMRAAELSGRSFTDFLVATLHEAARRIVHEHDVILLSAADSSEFMEALLNPPEPSETLLRAAYRYKEMSRPSGTD